MSSNIQITRICQYCRNEFTARTTSTKYCSHKCNSRHYKAKKKLDKIDYSEKETAVLRMPDIERVKTKEFLTVRDLSILIGCSVRTAYRLVNNGTIKGVNLCERMTRIKRSEIDKVLELPNKVPLSHPDNFDIENNAYTINEVQEKFKISQTALQTLIKRNNVPKIRKGKFAFVSKEVIDGLLK